MMTTEADSRIGLSLRWQICLLTALLIFASLVSLGLIAFKMTSDTVIDLTLDKIFAQTNDAASRIERILTVSRADAINVPGFPPIPGIVRTMAKGQPDADGSTTEIWIQRLEQILAAQMTTYQERSYCAVVDSDGDELMRVDRIRGNRFVLADADDLKNVGGEEYFLTARGLPEDEAYVSGFSLDQDGDPALYVASRYVGVEGQAVFVMKLDGNALTSAAADQIGEGRTDIVDEMGMFIYSDDPAVQRFDPRASYSESFPLRAARMQTVLGPEGDSFQAYISGSERPGAALVAIYQKIHLNPPDRREYLAIATSVEAETALEPVSRLANRFLLSGLAVLAVGVLITFWASSGLTSAIRKLAAAADEIAAGKLETPLPTVRKYGEVSGLTVSLDTMTRNLRRTIAHISEQDARTNAVLNATADALITIDADGIVQSFNSSAEKLFGYDEEEIIGKNVAILAPSPYREEHDQYLNRYRRSGDPRIIGKDRDLEGVRKDGSTFPISLRVTELRHGGEQVFIGTVQDITRRKKSEQERLAVSDAVREAVNRLAAASHEILATTAEQSAGTQQQASAVNESVATVEELAQTADQAAQRSDSVAEAARRSEEVGAAGREAVERSVAAMQEVKVQVESIAESILALAERAQAIKEITATVRDIAEQTNVLALNAAVEASRAGEHGKGFGVVAGEVKSLAEQSKKATGQVRQILEEIQQATNKAVLSTEDGTRAVGAAEEVVLQAGDTIGTLSQTLAESARSAVQISASANQQAAGVVQLNQGMKRIDQVTKQHVAAIREIERAAQNLNALSNELASLTSHDEVV